MSTVPVSLLHLCDSLFPIGAFSHSDGLEWATSVGQVATAADFEAWLLAVRDRSLRDYEGPGVARAWQACRREHWDVLEALDAELHALRPAAAAREASRSMGSRLLKTWNEIQPEARVAAAAPPALTLPAAFGCVAATAGISQADAVSGYMYTRLAASLSAAMRLMPLGQHQGHTLLASTLAGVPAVVDAVLHDDGPLQSFTPMMDIAAMRHQYVHSRLFRS